MHPLWKDISLRGERMSAVYEDSLRKLRTRGSLHSTPGKNTGVPVVMTELVWVMCGVYGEGIEHHSCHAAFVAQIFPCGGTGGVILVGSFIRHLCNKAPLSFD
ncbi:MAG: hypothetical protein WD604_11715 [Balneolaceae bacterium]